MVVATTIGTAVLTFGTAQFLVSKLTEVNTLLFAPVSCQIHEKSASAKTEASGRAYQVLNYLGRPTDRLIQAAVAPIFIVSRYIRFVLENKREMQLREGQHDFQECQRRYRWNAGLAVVAVPALLILGLLNSVGLLVKGVGELVFPLVTVCFIKQGKEGATLFGKARQVMEERHKTALFVTKWLAPTKGYDRQSLAQYQEQAPYIL